MAQSERTAGAGHPGHLHLDDLARLGGVRRTVAAHIELTPRLLPWSSIVVLLQGWVMRYKNLPSGTRQVLEIQLPGEIIAIDGLFFDRPRHGLVSLTELALLIVQPRSIEELLFKHPRFGARLIAALCTGRRRLDLHLALIGQSDAMEKLVAFLLEIHNRLKRRGLIRGPRFAMPLTQQQIADHLGFTLVYVNRLLRRLSEERVVTVHHSEVEIHDLAALRARTDVADELDEAMPAVDAAIASADARPLFDDLDHSKEEA
jgi:CRP-like cAMP-binding protein